MSIDELDDEFSGLVHKLMEIEESKMREGFERWAIQYNRIFEKYKDREKAYGLANNVLKKYVEYHFN